MKDSLPSRMILALYLLGLAGVGFWPTPVDKPIAGTLDAVIRYLHRQGAPQWFDYHFVEASANVVMFIPFGVLMAIALPARPWWQLSIMGLVASTCMELGQYLFIAARVASLLDVVTNTLGAVLGIAATRLVIDRGSHLKGTSSAARDGDSRRP